MERTRLALATPILAILFVIAGCASAGSTAEATRDRTVTVTTGNVLVVRLPASVTSNEWRLVKWDSQKLRAVQANPRLEETANGTEWVARFTAQSTGTVEVIYERVASGPNAEGPIGEQRRFRFSIRS